MSYKNIAIMSTIVFLALSLISVSVSYLGLLKEYNQIAVKNISLMQRNNKLTKFIYDYENSGSDTIITVVGVNYDVVGTYFKEGATTCTFYRFVHVGTGKK